MQKRFRYVFDIKSVVPIGQLTVEGSDPLMVIEEVQKSDMWVKARKLSDRIRLDEISVEELPSPSEDVK